MDNLWSIIRDSVSKGTLSEVELALVSGSLSDEEQNALNEYLKGKQYSADDKTAQWI